MSELFPEELQLAEDTIYDSSSEATKVNDNITKMLEEIHSRGLFNSESENRGLINVFTGISANNLQTHDLLNFRDIGEREYNNFIKCRILRLSSSNEAPSKKHRLQTMDPGTKVGKKVLMLKDKVNKQVTKCLRRRLAWCNATGQRYDPGLEQYSVYPRALSDCKGNPSKGVKSTWTAKLREYYPSAFGERRSWTPDTVVIDAMFLLNTTPRRQSKTIGSYAD